MKKLSILLLGLIVVFVSCDITGNTSVSESTGNTTSSGSSGGSQTTWEDLAWFITAETANIPDGSTYNRITAKTTLNRVTIYANSSQYVDIDANSKSIDDISFTHRCKLGGTGSLDANDVEASYRVLAFPVVKNSIIKIYAQSASSTADRQLKLSNLSGSYSITGTALGANISKVIETTYTGDETTLYVYSASSGINIYGIYVTKQ